MFFGKDKKEVQAARYNPAVHHLNERLGVIQRNITENTQRLGTYKIALTNQEAEKDALLAAIAKLEKGDYNDLLS